MSRPLSVIMPTYNGLPYLCEQIDTILLQLEYCDELLIVDDCSTDGTVEFLRDLKKRSDKNIRVIENRKNIGVLKNIRKLILNAQKDLIVFSDQDDIWLPNKLKITRDLFLEKSLCLLLHNAKYQCEDPKHLLKDSTSAEHLGVSTSFLKNIIRNRYIGCCMAIDRTYFPFVAIDKIPMMPMHDWFLSSYALRKYDNVHVLPECLIKHRRHAKNLTVAKVTLKNKVYQRLVLMRELLL